MSAKRDAIKVEKRRRKARQKTVLAIRHRPGRAGSGGSNLDNNRFSTAQS